MRQKRAKGYKRVRVGHEHDREDVCFVHLTGYEPGCQTCLREWHINGDTGVSRNGPTYQDNKCAKALASWLRSFRCKEHDHDPSCARCNASGPPGCTLHRYHKTCSECYAGLYRQARICEMILRHYLGAEYIDVRPPLEEVRGKIPRAS